MLERSHTVRALSTLNSRRKSSEKCDVHCARVVKKRAIILPGGGDGGIRVRSDKGGEIHPGVVIFIQRRRQFC